MKYDGRKSSGKEERASDFEAEREKNERDKRGEERESGESFHGVNESLTP